ncbi:hypothetical protein LCGC14_1930680 [marine sediment metagenome]|uniref:Uncharacterized protein n=1 Tax=marine sediment metagenome TaxID=412755 RepID=A0A0F9I211_9ZZZZ
MKLKTLKDWRHDLPDFIMKEIKAEAIKWVKDMNSKGIFGFAQPFMKFFNITEEELKK